MTNTQRHARLLKRCRAFSLRLLRRETRRSFPQGHRRVHRLPLRLLSSDRRSLRLRHLHRRLGLLRPRSEKVKNCATKYGGSKCSSKSCKPTSKPAVNTALRSKPTSRACKNRTSADPPP